MCNPFDVDKHNLGHVMGKSGTCWRNVHHAHLNVYDLTVYIHPLTNQTVEELVGAENVVWVFKGWSNLTNLDFVDAILVNYAPVRKFGDLGEYCTHNLFSIGCLGCYMHVIMVRINDAKMPPSADWMGPTPLS